MKKGTITDVLVFLPLFIKTEILVFLILVSFLQVNVNMQDE